MEGESLCAEQPRGQPQVGKVGRLQRRRALKVLFTTGSRCLIRESYEQDLVVSVRTPARGATGRGNHRVSGRAVSIRAPARGATEPDAATRPPTMFQSARPRGARLPETVASVPLVGFNPRAREGRDTFVVPVTVRAKGFNPRAREGRDSRPLGLKLEGRSFNPRAREGRDPAGLCWRSGRCWFQSARPRGARPATQPALAFAYRFQSARPRGARQRVRPIMP